MLGQSVKWLKQYVMEDDSHLSFLRGTNVNALVK